jgi:16S rRNA processing protein RimM
VQTDDEKPREELRIGVALVGAPHGLKGEVSAEMLTEFPKRFKGLRRLYIGESDTILYLEGYRFHKDRILLKFRDIDTPEDASRLRGAMLTVPADETVQLPRDHYYHYQLIGLEVRTTDGRVLGKLEDILTTTSNDVFIVRGPLGEILLPATKEVVREVDVASGTMIVQPLPGMVD